MKTLLTLIVALAMLAGCVSNPTGTGATTQPSLDASSLAVLAISDYEALVAAGIVKETPALDAAIVAVMTAQKEYAEGKGTVQSLNDAGLQLAIALKGAKK